MHDYVVWIAVAAMAAIAVGLLIRFGREGRGLNEKLNELDSLLAEERGSRARPEVPDETLKRPRSLKPGNEQARRAVEPLWAEWGSSLVPPQTAGGGYYRTFAAAEVFTPERLIPGVSRYRGLLSAPSFFTGAGVLATFIGLAVGFKSLDFTADGTGSDNIIDSAGGLVSAAGFAFVASLVGVALSLFFSVLEKQAERRAVNRIINFQDRLDSAYPLLTPEHSLVQIAHSQQLSTEALQELHERIGNRLQEALEQQSSTMREALSTSISESLAPAMSTLVDATTKQSSAVFETLIERFAMSFTELGTQQRNAMEQAASHLQSTINALGTQISEITTKLGAHAEELAAQQASTLESLKLITETLTTTTNDLGTASSTLSDVSDHFVSASGVLARDLSDATSTLTATFDQIEAQAKHGAELTENTLALSTQLASSAQEMAESTTNMGANLEKFSDIQDSFHQDLQRNAIELSDGLRGQVERMSSQVSEWLAKYAVDTEKQIELRMETWNNVSHEYARSMLATAQALHAAVDELPRAADVLAEEMS